MPCKIEFWTPQSMQLSILKIFSQTVQRKRKWEQNTAEKKKKKWKTRINAQFHSNPLHKQIFRVTLWNNVKLKSIIITKKNIVNRLIKWFPVRSWSWWLKSWSQNRNEIPFYFIIWKDYSMQKSNFSEW